MSRKLGRNELISTSILILVLLVGSFVGQVYYGLTNGQIVRIVTPLGFLAIAVERLLKKNHNLDEKLVLNEKERKSDSLLIWAGLACLFLIFFIGYALQFAKSLFHLILILIVVPLVTFAVYLIIRSRIKKNLPNDSIK
jgi:uncharacterized membrane protein YfcA